MRLVTVVPKSFKFSLLPTDSVILDHVVRGDQEGLFELVILNFIFKWYNWSNFRC
jgi:hypothetical protein